jgi:hypothetical protein
MIDEMIESIDKFLAFYFGEIGKWIFVGVVGISIFMSIAVLVASTVTFGYVFFVDLLLWAVVAFSLYLYDKHRG